MYYLNVCGSGVAVGSEREVYNTNLIVSCLIISYCIG